MKQKVEIMSMTNEILSPITKASNVLLEDGSNVQQLIDNYVEPEFTPTIETSSPMSKIGQGDNVDFSANVINGAYESCVLKGKTLVNYNAEGNDRNEYVCMPSLEGSNLTVNGTVEGKVKNAILKGNTEKMFLPKKNIFNGKYEMGSFNSVDGSPINSSTIMRSVDFLEIKPNEVYSISNNLSYGTRIWFFDKNKSFISSIATSSVSTPENAHYFRLTHGVNQLDMNVKTQVELGSTPTDYEEPNYELISVKMPVLTTCGKNLFDGEMEVGNISFTDGTPISDTRCVRSKNFTFVKSGVITFSSDLNYSVAVLGYDYNKNFVGKLSDSLKVTVPDNVSYIKFRTGMSSLQNNEKVKFQIEQGSVSTSYEPYKSNTLTTPQDVVLRKVGDIQDTLDLITGELTQRIGEVVLDGSENWILTSDENETTIRFATPLQGSKPTNIICEQMKVEHTYGKEYECIQLTDNKTLVVRISKEKAKTVESFKEYLQQNPITVLYQLETPIIKTVDLSGQKVYSYDGTTHYTCSSAEGSLIPTLTIEEGVKYQAIIKPSTKYSIIFNRTVASDSLTVDLGGATANVSSATTGKTIVQITTLPTLSHNYVKFLGVGNAIKDVQIIEGDVADDVEYFEGMIDVENPSVMFCNSPIIFGKGGRI